jgi:AcrR family transcriptional regulator
VLFAAAITLVTERETTAITVSDLADAADVSRRVIYQQFKDKDSLLLEAGLDFARRARQERRERIGDGPEMARARLVAMGAHFAEHRGLYRTMLTGSCAYAFGQALCELFASGNRQLVRRRYGDELDPAVEQDLTDFLTGGTATIVHSWVVSAPDPLDPEVLVERLGRLLPLVLGPGPASGAS